MTKEVVQQVANVPQRPVSPHISYKSDVVISIVKQVFDRRVGKFLYNLLLYRVLSSSFLFVSDITCCEQT